MSTRYTLADGLAVAQAGGRTFSIARSFVDQLVQIQEEDIAFAMLRLAELEKCIVEGAVAAGLAAMLGGDLPELAGRKVVLLLTGGNIDSIIAQPGDRARAGRRWTHIPFRCAVQ